MFIYMAPPSFAIASPSSGMYTIAAEPPTASCALATRLMVTVFVMDGAIGFFSLTLCTASRTAFCSSSFPIMIPPNKKTGSAAGILPSSVAPYASLNLIRFKESGIPSQPPSRLPCNIYKVTIKKNFCQFFVI